jgi:spermidine/putrescine transport system permease protein
MTMPATQPKRAKRVSDVSIGLTIFAFAYLAFLYVPVLFLPLFSFNDSIFIKFPLSGFTLKWYEQMLNDRNMLDALGNSLKVGIFAAITATILGLLAAKAITRYAMRGANAALGIIMLPLFIPEIILGISLLILFNTVSIPLSLVSVAAGHILLTVPFAMAVLISRMDGFDKSLEEASLDLGESGWSTFWRITFPLVMPGIVSSLLLTFIVSFDEFLIAFFLAGTDSTLPVYIWAQLRFPAKLPGVLALGALILLVSCFLVVFSEWFRRRGVTEGNQGFGI